MELVLLWRVFGLAYENNRIILQASIQNMALAQWKCNKWRNSRIYEE